MSWKRKIEFSAILTFGAVLAITEADIVGAVFVILVALIVAIGVTIEDKEKKQ